jgi:hypothetical protein
MNVCKIGQIRWLFFNLANYEKKKSLNKPRDAARFCSSNILTAKSAKTSIERRRISARQRRGPRLRCMTQSRTGSRIPIRLGWLIYEQNHGQYFSRAFWSSKFVASLCLFVFCPQGWRSWSPTSVPNNNDHSSYRLNKRWGLYTHHTTHEEGVQR